MEQGPYEPPAEVVRWVQGCLQHEAGTREQLLKREALVTRDRHAYKTSVDRVWTPAGITRVTQDAVPPAAVQRALDTCCVKELALVKEYLVRSGCIRAAAAFARYLGGRAVATAGLAGVVWGGPRKSGPEERPGWCVFLEAATSRGHERTAPS